MNPSNPTAEDLSAAAAYFDKELTVVQAVLTDLEHLGEPPQNRQTFDGAITALRQAAGDAQSADQAAKAGDANSFKTRLTSYKGDVTQADSLLQSFGTTHCGRSPGEASPSSTGNGPPTIN
ncbi:MAG: hypothetical protein M3N98_09310 [Actinomycetota bacterium]|nr:hypothetical protein [Actinomycetota bacterium]